MTPKAIEPKGDEKFNWSLMRAHESGREVVLHPAFVDGFVPVSELPD